MRFLSSRSLIVLLSVTIAACESPSNLTDADLSQSPGVTGANQDAQVATRSRYDTPWREMSDRQLKEVIAEANGHVIIGFKAPGARGGVSEDGTVLVSSSQVAEAKDRLQSEFGVSPRREYELIPAMTTVLDSSVVDELRVLAILDYIEPAIEGQRATPQDTTWNIEMVRAPSAWNSSDGFGAKLMIIDSGIDEHHDDLNAPVHANCVDQSPPYDENGHGTAVAGVASALDNSIDMIGAGHGADLWSVKDGDDLPQIEATTCGVEFGRNNDVQAINISSVFGSPSTALTDQINAAWSEGIVVVAAAGNDGSSVGYPATLDNTIAVGAVTEDTIRWSASNTGPELDIVAPGVNAISTRLGGGTDSFDGTSVATPAVTAAAVAMKADDPSLSAYEVESRLYKTAVDLSHLGTTYEYGSGLLDIEAAVNYTPLSVDINGPSNVQPNASCYWSSTVSGGNSPYSYSWTKDGSDVGSESDITLDTGTSSFTLKLDVTDVAGTTGSDEMNITVDSNAPQCVQ